MDPGAGGDDGEALPPFEQRQQQRKLKQPAPRSPTSNSSSNMKPPPERLRPSTTASLPERPSSHQRGVSWGEAHVHVFDGVQEHLSLNDVFTTSSNDDEDKDDKGKVASATANEAYEAAVQATTSDVKGLSSLSRVHLDDLMKVHPIENEAESHILKALERIEMVEGEKGPTFASEEKSLHDRYNSGDYVTLLGNIPKGAEGIFTSPPSEDGAALEDAESVQQRPRAFSAASQYDDYYPPSSPVSPKYKYSTPVVDSVWQDANTQQKHNSSGRYGRHRRMKTMEEKLVGLTDALDAMNKQNLPPATAATNYYSDIMRVPASSGDATFAQNVSLLFRDSNNVSSSHEEELKLLLPSSWNDNEIPENHSSRPPSSVAISQQSVEDEDSEDSSTPNKATENWAKLKAAILLGQPMAAAIANSTDTGDISNGCVTTPVMMSTIEEATAAVNNIDDVEEGVEGRGDSIAPLIFRKKTSWFRRLLLKLGIVCDINDFLQPRRRSIWIFTSTMLWLILSSLGVAFVLFYLVENPPTGKIDRDKSVNGTLITEDGKTIALTDASASWWILFIVRQLITFSLAYFMEIVIVDFICIDRRWSLFCLGPTFTLLLVQANGWPFVLFFWALFDLAMLYGDRPFVAHWAFAQEWLDIFNSTNPSGGVAANELYLHILLIALGAAGVVAIQRFLIGFYQGRKIFAYYAEDLAGTMKKILLVSQVATLAVQLERERQFNGENHEQPNLKASRVGLDEVIEKGVLDDDESEHETKSQSSVGSHTSMPFISEKATAYDTGQQLSYAQKRRIQRLLGNWEEPDAAPIGVSDSVSIASILQFQTSLKQLGKPFPFSYAFGRASTREECIESAQNVYLRLLAETPGEKSLHFNVLALVALQSNGELIPDKVRDLVHLMRPGRNGYLRLIDFVKSVDSVYKEIRLLRASVRNSQKIDQSSERIFNVVFYTVLVFICLALLGIDPLALFLSLSSFLLAFSFAISRAASNYFEGLIFILGRRPYDIGDRIVVQPVDAVANWHGSTDWIVRDICLTHTTIVYAFTNEIATVSNGSLANSRVMNGARSPHALLYVNLRFGIDVQYGQIQIFSEALTRYIDFRPREWAKMWAFRAQAVQADKGYIEYLAVLEHRESWQELDTLVHSRGQVRSFCHELAKQLDMRYQQPSLPVDLRMRGSFGDALQEDQQRLQAQMEGLSADSEAIRNIIQDNKR